MYSSIPENQPDPSLVKVPESPEAALLAPNVVGREAVVAAALDVQGGEVHPEVHAGILIEGTVVFGQQQADFVI